MDESAQLLALFLSALSSATILPGTSDAALMFIVSQQPHLQNKALWVAVAGNSLGSYITYGMGRMLPEKVRQRLSANILARLQKWGTPLLLLSWLPVIGDALPLAAGWLRLSVWTSALFILAGKTIRYCVLVYAATAF